VRTSENAPFSRQKWYGVESDAVTEDKGRAAILTEASLLMAVVFLGTNPVAVKLAVLDVPPLPFVAIRFLLAGLVLLSVALLLGQGREVGRKDLLNMAGVGFVGVAMNNVAFTLGVSMTTASDTALIYAAVPIWGILLGLALGLERPTLWGVVGVALAFLGVGVVLYGGFGGGESSLEGDSLVVIATMCWGSYAVLSLPLLRTYSPLTVAAYTMLFGGLAALPLAVPSFVVAEWGQVSSGAWRAMAYSTLLVAAYGFWAWQWGVSRVGANRVLVYQYLITLVGVVSGVVLLGEGLTTNKILGGAVILLGVYLARRQ
jgi:drug/metabolite transporter (DMT)-like permease